MRYLPVFFFSLVVVCSPTLGMASQTDMSSSIDNFVSRLYPKGSPYFWVINNTTTESSQEMIVDILTTLKNHSNETQDESRFLLLVINGEIFAAQKIPLDAEVDCENEEEV